MSSKKNTAKGRAGIFQLDNGYWGYRYTIKVDGYKKDTKRTTDEFGRPFKTKTAAKKAREQAIINDMNGRIL